MDAPSLRHAFDTVYETIKVPIHVGAFLGIYGAMFHLGIWRPAKKWWLGRKTAAGPGASDLLPAATREDLHGVKSHLIDEISAMVNLLREDVAKMLEQKAESKTPPPPIFQELAELLAKYQPTAAAPAAPAVASPVVASPTTASLPVPEPKPEAPPSEPVPTVIVEGSPS